MARMSPPRLRASFASLSLLAAATLPLTAGGSPAAQAAPAGATTASPAAIIASAPATASCVPAGRAVPNPSVRSAPDDGPRSPVNRRRQGLIVSCPPGAKVVDVDLGDVALPGAPRFRSPVRGVLVLPRGGAGRAPLVIVSHLRHSGCAGGEMAYPCRGGNERRLDRGMTHLGVDLARRGYAVLIPDLAPVWVGGNLDDPYDQQAAWQLVVDTLRDRVARAARGTDGILGSHVVGRVDTSRAGLVVHSRSAYVAGAAISRWAAGPTRIVSVLAYGPAYDATNESPTTPIIGDVPYLAVQGRDDHDVPSSASRWLGTHVTTRRVSPALVLDVPGYGHNYVNRALSAAKADDRTACTGRCASPAQHERLLQATAGTWFDATMRGRRARGLPLRSHDPLPARFAGAPATWLAGTNRGKVVAFDSHAPVASRVAGGELRTCRFYDPMIPVPHRDACPEPDLGVVEVNSAVSVLTLTRSSGIRVRGHQARATQLVVHAAPFGDRADRAPHSPLRATLRLANGRRVFVDVPAGAMLRNRADRQAAGTYTIMTARVPLPAAARGQRVESVTLTSGSTRTTRLILRAIELV